MIKPDLILEKGLVSFIREGLGSMMHIYSPKRIFPSPPSVSPFLKLLALLACSEIGVFGEQMVLTETSWASDSPVVLKTQEFQETSQSETVDPENQDSLEPLNKGLYLIHSLLDFVIAKPLALGYQFLIPEPVRSCVGHVLSNMSEPVSALNHGLQGNPYQSGKTLVRFCINTVLGAGGMFDPADPLGLPESYTNFSDTLGLWGIGTGPYLFVPLMGPSSLRGTVGFVADYFSNPFTYCIQKQPNASTLRYTVAGVKLAHERHLILKSLQDLEATSPDLYVAIQSIYWQKQDAHLADLKAERETLPTETHSSGDTDSSSS